MLFLFEVWGIELINMSNQKQHSNHSVDSFLVLKKDQKISKFNGLKWGVRGSVDKKSVKDFEISF
jgi:hypothetical protein